MCCLAPGPKCGLSVPVLDPLKGNRPFRRVQKPNHIIRNVPYPGGVLTQFGCLRCWEAKKESESLFGVFFFFFFLKKPEKLTKGKITTPQSFRGILFLFFKDRFLLCNSPGKA
jgi:hypothetical protein